MKFDGDFCALLTDNLGFPWNIRTKSSAMAAVFRSTDRFDKKLGTPLSGDVPKTHKKVGVSNTDLLRHGASDEARTRYLHLGKVALYQMSYTRNNSGYYSGTWRKSQPLNSKIRKIFRRRAG